MTTYSSSKRFAVLGVALALSIAGINPAQAAVTKPGTVGSLSVSAGDGKIVATWGKPSGNGSMTYTASLTPSGKKCTTPTLTCTFTGLLNGTSYTVSVIAKNSKGSGAAAQKTAIPASAVVRITGEIASSLSNPAGGNCQSISLTSSSECGLKIVAILPSGRVFASSLNGASNKFKIDVNAGITDRAKLTLHLIRGNGSYVGPVVLTTSGNVAKTGLTSYSSSADLGVLTLRTVSSKTAFATSANSPGAVLVGSGVTMTNGAPAGAGHAGFVRSSNRVNSVVQRSINSLPRGNRIDFVNSSSDPCASVAPGGDTDVDGVPNVVDVDDNNDGRVDMADPTANNSCTIEPTKGVRTNIGRSVPLNYGWVNAAVANGTSRSSAESSFNQAVNEYVGGDEFGIGYYIYSTRFLPGIATDSTGLVKAAWITCPGVQWCDPSTSKARNGTNVEQLNFGNASNSNVNGQNNSYFEYRNSANGNAFTGGTDWVSTSPCASSQGQSGPCWGEITRPMQFGTVNSECRALTYNKSYQPTGIPRDAKNFLWQTVCKEGRNLRQVLGASISPRIGALSSGISAREALSPQDVLTINYPAVGGGVASVASTIGVYPITSPMVKSFNANGQVTNDVGMLGTSSDVGSEQNPITLGDSNSANLGVTFLRPQRTQLDGEAGTTGYHDLYGLNYGLQIELGNAQFGCGAGQFTQAQWHALSSDQKNSSHGGVGSNNYTAPQFGNRDGQLTGDSYSNYLAPLTDTVATDPGNDTPAAGSTSLDFSVNMKDCLTQRIEWLNDSAWAPIGESAVSLADFESDENNLPFSMHPQINRNGLKCISMNLVARGEDRTGGTDTALQGFCLRMNIGSLDPTGDSIETETTLPRFGAVDTSVASSATVAVRNYDAINATGSCTWSAKWVSGDGQAHDASFDALTKSATATGVSGTYQIEVNAQCGSSIHAARTPVVGNGGNNNCTQNCNNDQGTSFGRVDAIGSDAATATEFHAYVYRFDATRYYQFELHRRNGNVPGAVTVSSQDGSGNLPVDGGNVSYVNVAGFNPTTDAGDYELVFNEYTSLAPDRQPVNFQRVTFHVGSVN